MISSISSLTDHRQDLQIVVEGEIGIRQGLGLHALGGVHHQHSALARGERAADLVVEVHMARGVNQVQGIAFPVGSLIIKPHGAGLDGDAALALKIHVVKDLILHDALLHRAAFFDEAVGERGFAVVDMGDDGEIADFFLRDHTSCPFPAYSFMAALASPIRPRRRSR